MSVFLPSLTMFTIGTSLMMTIRLSVMNLARQAEKPTSTTATRQPRSVATATR
jgi:hypothetical protein